VGAELFHADGLTDMTKLTVAFRKFANAPKNTLCSVPSIRNGNYVKNIPTTGIKKKKTKGRVFTVVTNVSVSSPLQKKTAGKDD
jgi:putative cell wall-binding protein